MVTSNIINEGECAGILADSGTTGNTTTPNTFYNVTYKVASSTTGCSFAPAGPGTGHRAFSPKGRPQKNAQAGR
jgi:hypothetical protein